MIHHRIQESDYCDNCGKPEEIKEVCKHCGYEYPQGKVLDAPMKWFIGAIAAVVVSAILAAILIPLYYS